MDKKIRNLLILVGVLVLLCVGYAVAGILFPAEEAESEEYTQAVDETVSLFRVTEDGLTALSYTYDEDGDGEAELWAYTRDEAGAWVWSEDAAVPLGKTLFANYASTLASATAVKVLSGVTEAQLEEYGLRTPAKKVTFTDAAGGSQSFCVGVYNAYNGTYCVTVNGDDTKVYLVSAELCEAFEEPVTAFVSFDDLPTCEPEAIVSLTLSQGERTVTLTRQAPASVDEAAVWLRSVNGEAPVTVAADLSKSLELLAGDMDYLACMDVRASAYPTYGLDENTTTMTLVYLRSEGGTEVEETFTLTLGAVDQYLYYYARPEGTTLSMMLGGSVFYKVMTYDDERLAEGDETDTTAS